MSSVLFLSKLVHIDGEGWCILASMRDDIEQYEFYTLEDGRTFFTNCLKNRSRQACQVKYTEVDSIDLKEGDLVFYLINTKEISGHRKNNRVRMSSISAIDYQTGSVVLHNQLILQLYQVIKFKHNLAEIEDTEACICNRCKALHTPKYKAA